MKVTNGDDPKTVVLALFEPLWVPFYKMYGLVEVRREWVLDEDALRASIKSESQFNSSLIPLDIHWPMVEERVMIQLDSDFGM